MTTELVIGKPVIKTLEVEGHKLRSVEVRGLVCVRDILTAIGIKSTQDWIERLIQVSNLDKNNKVSNRVNLEYFDVGEANPAAFTNEAGILEILARSRKPTAKAVLMSLIEKIKARVPDFWQSIQLIAAGVMELESRVRALEMGNKHLIPAPSIPEVSTRLKISQLVRKFVARQATGYTYQDAFDKLYYEYKYRYHVDLKERAKNAKATSIMDYAEYTDIKEGTHYVQELYNLALVLFPES